MCIQQVKEVESTTDCLGVLMWGRNRIRTFTGGLNAYILSASETILYRVPDAFALMPVFNKATSHFLDVMCELALPQYAGMEVRQGNPIGSIVSVR